MPDDNSYILAVLQLMFSSFLTLQLSLLPSQLFLPSTILSTNLYFIRIIGGDKIVEYVARG